MSVILKALKKLEQETTPAMGSDGKPDRERLSPRKPRLAWAWILAGGLFFLGAGIGVFRVIHPPPQAPPLEKSLAPEPVDSGPIRDPGIQGEVKTPIQAIHEAAPLPDMEFHNALSKTTKGADLSRDPEIPLQPESVAASEPSGEAGGIEQAENLPPPAVMAEQKPPRDAREGNLDPPYAMASAGGDTLGSAEDAAAPNPESPLPPAGTKIPVLNDPGISLQAISWSADPDKRLAVINGKICREKEPIGGYVLDAINAADVVVSKGGKSGKLMFKIR
jgi:hypothetical protein